MLKVLSIDPGVTTGYTLATKDNGKFFIACNQQQFTHTEFWMFLRKTGIYGTMHTVCEDFEFRQGKQKDGLNLYPVELIGVLRLFCNSDQWYPLWMQKAAQGKGYFDDNKLKKMKVYQKGLEHGRDATRHLLHWFTFGAGYQFNDEPEIELVEEEWIRAAYF